MSTYIVTLIERKGIVKFAELIRKKREEKNLTVRALERMLSERSGGLAISRTLISYLETGDRIPTYDVAYAVAEVLEIDIIDVIRAAYVARSEHSQDKESKYLRGFIEKTGLGWDPDIIIKAK